MKLKVGAKIIAGYLIILVLMIIVAVFGVKGISQTQSDFDSIMSRRMEITGNIKDLRYHIANQAAAFRGYLYNGNQALYKQFEAQGVEADKTEQALASLITTSQAKAFLVELTEQHKQYEGLAKQCEDYLKQGKNEEIKPVLVEGSKVLTDIEATGEEWNKFNEQRKDEDMAKADAYAHSAINRSIGVTVLAIVLGLGLGWWRGRAISKPIQDLSEVAMVLGKGDLSREVPDIKSGDEIQQLADSFNLMLQSLRKIVRQINEASLSVASASSQLSANSNEVSKATQQVAKAIEDVAKGVSEQTNRVNVGSEIVNQSVSAIQQIASGASAQSQSVNMAAEIVNQMAKSIQDVASGASQVALAAGETAEAAKAGRESVLDTINGMERIKDKVYDTAGRIKELGEQSQQIGEIIQVIDDIAEQTNLLALNAAIEAARAGEHGKGFAVVADEVRKLAERSGKATKEIAELITTIQQGTQRAVNAMEEGTSEVAEGSRLAAQAGTSLDNIIKNVELTNNQVQNISAAAEEISASSTEVVNAIDSVASITEENTAATEEMSAGAEQTTLAMQEIAKVAEDSAAAAEEVSASTEEMTASVEEIAASAQALEETADLMNELVGQFILKKINKSCHEVMNCNLELRKKCPAFNSEEKRCWLIPNTWCGGVQQGDVKSKRHRCMNCNAFKVMTGEGTQDVNGAKVCR